MRNSFKRSSAGGFTLVELIVVIAIIAILAGVLLGSYSLAIAKANLSKCSSNLHQIGVGMLAFAGDNNNCLPESGGVIYYNATDSTTGKAGWTQQIEQYVGTDKSIYQCPDSKSIVTGNANYSYFNGAHAAKSATGGFAAVNLMLMKSPSQHIIAGDIAFNTGLTDPLDDDKDDYSQDPAFNGKTSATGSPTIPIHKGTVNILYADGHVENCKYFDNTTMTTVYSGVNSANVYLQ